WWCRCDWFHSVPLRAAGAIEIFSEEVVRGLVEMTLSRVIFRNMTSEDRADEAQARTGRAGDEPGGEDRAGGDRAGGDRAGGDLVGGGEAGRGQAGGDQDGPRPRGDRLQLDLTDPKAMRALAHPLRWALLEALGHAGTLTATQASDMLGESPANCAFHLRTLARYGFVEEAGGGKGRERPWRQAYRR